MSSNLPAKEWNNKKWLIIKSDYLTESIKLINSTEFENYEGIIVSRDLGYKLQDLSFLKQTPNLLSISVSDAFHYDNSLECLNNLNTLNLAGKEWAIDLSLFPKLVELSFDWQNKLTNLDKCYSLEKLVVAGYKSPENDLSELKKLVKLKSISLIKSSISSLSGLRKCTNLNEIILTGCSKLTDISEMKYLQITELEFDGCKNIKNYAALKNLSELKKLKILDCDEMYSIDFVKSLTQLEFFTFRGTKVIDGDISPCEKIRYVNFDNKRNYSHTLNDIKLINKSIQA